MDIPVEHKRTILSSKSWGMNTSYGVGAKFQTAVEDGKTPSEAIKEEIDMLKMVYESPVDAQVKLMEEAGHTSFDTRKYMETYKQSIRKTVKNAMNADVFYGNIVTVPAYEHHVFQPDTGRQPCCGDSWLPPFFVV